MFSLSANEVGGEGRGEVAFNLLKSNPTLRLLPRSCLAQVREMSINPAALAPSAQ